MKQKEYIHITGMILLIFMSTYAVLALVGFVPEQFKFVSTKTPVETPKNPDVVVKGKAGTELIPDKIEIKKIGVNSTIQKPQSVDVSVLDEALTKGAVYYPGAGTLQQGNIFLFGHSTNWKVINNQAYKTFNDLDKLKAGDEVELTSNGVLYIYEVQTVTLAADSDVRVDFQKEGRMLTISTCDTFGRKQDRYVVEAEFKEIR